MYKHDLELLHDYIDRLCLFRADPEQRYTQSLPAGKFHGKGPGNVHTWAFFLRRLTQNPKMLRLVCKHLLREMMCHVDLQEPQTYQIPFQLAGMETSANPLLIGLAHEIWDRFGFEVNTFTIRKTRKSYCLHNFIDGRVNDLPVIVVDDTLGSGSSFQRAYDTISRELELEVIEHSFAIIDVNSKHAVKYGGKSYAVHTLFQGDEFDKRYDRNKYWIPSDCTLDRNKRTDYI